MQQLQSYERLAPFYDNLMASSHFYRNLRLEELSLFGKYVLPAEQGQTALDAGCGTGDFSRLLDSLGYETYAVDQSLPMLRFGRAKVDKTFPVFQSLNADLLSLPLKKTFDVIVAFGSLINHLSEWNTIFQLLGKHLKMNGLLLFDVDNYLGLDSFSQIYLRLRSTLELKKWIRDIVGSMKTSRGGMGYTSNWAFFVEDERISLYLTYYPSKFLRRTLHNSGFEVVEKRGSNLFTCLLPWWIKSAAMMEGCKIHGWKEAITKAMLAIDRVLLTGDKLVDFAANTLFVVRKSSLPR